MSGGFLDSLDTGWQDFKLGLAGTEDAAAKLVGLDMHNAAEVYTSDVNPGALTHEQAVAVEDNGLLPKAVDMTASDIASGAGAVVDAATSALEWVKPVLIAVAVIVAGIAVIYVVHVL